jgi:RHS repeat-associated protein
VSGPALDANGNTLTKATASGTTQYAWDFENRLTSVTLPGSGGTVTFKYDPLGRRIQKSGPNGTTNFVYDEANIIAEVDNAGNEVARYDRTESLDEPLAEVRSGTTAFYQQDGLGSVTSLSSLTGTLSNTYTYDTFGNLIASTGSLGNPFQYTARDYDSETGLFYYRARYYDPALGRFISEDPVGFVAGVNFYVYAADSPSNLIDPTGFAPCCPKQEEKKIFELLQAARDYIADLQAGRPYVAKHGIELARTTCIAYRAPNGRPSKEPLGQGVISMHIDPNKEPCIYKCVFTHEQVHQKMCETLGTDYSKLTVAQKEIPAFQKEIGCYLQMIRSGGLGPSRKH